VASLGVSDPVFESEGTDRLRVVLPGLSAARLAEARGQLSKLGRIEFRLVHLQSDAMVKGTVPPDPACERIEQTITKDGVAAKTFLFAQRKPALSGEQVVGVKIAEGNRGWGLTLTFDAVGARLFKDVTSKNAGAQLALVIDGVVISAPNINEPILGGTAAISGAFTFNEARDLAAVLAHPLPNPVAIEEEKILPPSSNGVTAPSL
jgi:preprotein translocase subunit SecD